MTEGKWEEDEREEDDKEEEEEEDEEDEEAEKDESNLRRVLPSAFLHINARGRRMMKVDLKNI